ncbi:hypothetical protein [Dactylosporangium sp. NPDC005555]|uniref:hypothetical protein n=1 Tax=Dactylosporangium sp. NPDC005555 TaxID=3154889 RepID=UPI0033BF1297
MTSSPADPTVRLVRALRELFDQVPDLQRRYRAAMSRIRPDEALGLADAWTAFHRALTDARYEPGTGGLLHPADRTDRTGQPPERVMRVAADLSDARIRLREQLEAAEAAEPVTGPPQDVTLATVLARWRLLHRGEPELRWAVARAMAALPAADRCRVRGLAPLAAGYAAYLTAERALAVQWAVAADGRDPGAVAALDDRLSRTTGLRDRLDQLIAGYGEPTPPPPEPTLRPQFGPQPPARPSPAPPPLVGQPVGVEFRAALDGLHDGYPELIAGCRRFLGALGALSGRPRASSLREELLRAWGRYDDALAGLNQRINGDQAGHVTSQVTGWGLRATLDHAAQLRAELRHAAGLRAGLADQLAEAEAWLARTAAAADATARQALTRVRSADRAIRMGRTTDSPAGDELVAAAARTRARH